MSTLYSQLKPAWHPDRLVQLREKRRPVPVHVQLILSDLCNQDCGFCAYRMSSGLSSELFAIGTLAKVGHNNPVRQIPTEKAMEIVEDCAAMGVKALQFTGGGEPTVHPDHRQIFARAQELGIQTSLVTNGLKLKPDESCFHNMAWIRVSVDAGDAATYSKVRRVPEAHWDKVWANIDELAPQFNGVLGIGFVVTPENFFGIPWAAKRAKEAGATNMRVGAVFSEAGTSFYGDTIPRIADEVARAKDNYDGDGFEIIDLFGRRLGDLEHGRPTDPHCGYQKLTWYIGGDLNLYRCCNVAYTRAGTVTSLTDKRLVEVLAKDYHEPFDARSCRFCQFRGQNEAINALIREPEHVNFV